MKIVITGANGYIGTRLSLYLSGQGYEVIAVCFPEVPQDDIWFKSISESIIADVRDQKSLDKIAEFRADAIIHLVSLDHYDSEKEPNLVAEINIQPTWNLLNKCTSNGLKKFIYFSTIHVYGKNQQGLIKETQQPTPFNAYGLTHYLSEEICNYYNRKTDVDCINVRLSNSYGEPFMLDANCWGLIVNDLTKSAFENDKIVLKSDGSTVRDFIHFSDICKGVNELLMSDENNKNIIHFSSATSHSMLEIAVMVRDVFYNRYKKQIPIYINNDELWSGEMALSQNNQIISNLTAEEKNIQFMKQLNVGIDDLFKYLEYEICQK